MAKQTDPKQGTGKKPKGSGRRLYTDENPKDTVSIKFATPADARSTVAKVKRIKKPFARKIQILTVLEQRAKVAGKGPCGTSKDKKNPDRCLPAAKARSLSKKDRAATAKKKKKAGAKGKTVVSNTKKAKVKGYTEGGEINYTKAKRPSKRPSEKGKAVAKGCGAVMESKRKMTYGARQF